LLIINDYAIGNWTIFDAKLTHNYHITDFRLSNPVTKRQKRERLIR